MKRFFILATAAIVALASCAKTEVVYNDAPEQISFKQITGAMTKAEDLTGGELGVFANQNGTDAEYFGNTKFTWVDVDNVYKADKEWPREGSLDFTVYYPYSVDAKYDLSENVLTVPATARISEVYYGKERFLNRTKTSNPAVVLNHVCAKITVNFEGGSLYTFKSAEISGVNTAGNVEVDYDAPLTVTTVDPVGGSITTGAINFAASGAVNYVLPGDQKNISLIFTQNLGSADIEKEVPITGTWEANKHYIYNISVAANALITFTAEVEDFGTGATTYPTVE